MYVDADRKIDEASELLLNMYFTMQIKKLRKTVDPEDPYAHCKAEEWDSFSAQHFFHENLHSQGKLLIVLFHWTTFSYKLFLCIH